MFYKHGRTSLDSVITWRVQLKEFENWEVLETHVHNIILVGLNVFSYLYLHINIDQ